MLGRYTQACEGLRSLRELYWGLPPPAPGCWLEVHPSSGQSLVMSHIEGFPFEKGVALDAFLKSFVWSQK